MSKNSSKLSEKSVDNMSLLLATQNELINKLKAILIANHITDPVAEIIIEDPSLQGEGNGSQTSFVTVKFESFAKKPLHLFIKRELENPTRQEINRETKMFEKESVFFMEYIPLARQFCMRMGQDNLLSIYPKCYYGDPQTIVLENLLLDKNYFILNKEEMQDFEAAKFALTTLAKHHAISYALIKDIGGYETFLEKFPVFACEMYKTDIAAKMLPSMFEDAVTINLNILEKCSLEEVKKSKAIEVLKGFQGKVFEKMLDSLNLSQGEDYRVLNHGDYWNNNMMFHKDEVTEQLNDHIAIDFQVIRYCTPGVDLGYYLFTSVKHNVRQSRLQELLSIYIDVLKEATANLGYSIPIYYEQIYKDFCKTFKYGYFWGLTVATGAGYAVLRDMNPEEKGGGSEANSFTQLVTKWIAKNPRKSEKIAKLLVNVVEEYLQLTS